MNSVNVAIAVPIFPNIVQTYILNQLSTFRDLGVNFSIIAGTRPSNSTTLPVVVDYKLLDAAQYINTGPGHILQNILKTPIHNPRYRNAAKKILTEKQWDKYESNYRIKALIRARALAFRPFNIVHSHSMFSSYHYLFMREMLSIPLVTTYHGQVPRGVTKLEDRKMLQVLDNGDAFVVNTAYARDELINLGCNPHKIRMIPQGIILEKFPYIKRSIDTNEKIVLLTVGRISIEKGHHVVLQAIREIHDTLPGLEYHIVGDGPERQRLAAKSEEYGIKNKIFFHGFQTGIQLQQIYQTADLFVLPSINTGDGHLVETQGVVLQEAQAAGIPVIGSRCGGIPEVITDRDTGMLFDEGDYHALARIIAELINNKMLYAKLALTGRKDVEKRFDINIICRKLLDVYSEFVS